MWTSFAFVLWSTSEVKWKLLLCPTLCDPTDYTGHGILEARILEWVAFPFSRGSFQPGIEPRSPALQANSSQSWATREAQEYWSRQPIPSPEDCPNPGMEPGSPALQAGSLPTELSGKHEPVINSLQTSIGPQITLWGALVHTNLKKQHTYICHN